MKKSFLILLTFLLCIPGFSQKYFEGVVEYEITFQASSPDINEAALKRIFGTKLKFYYKEGTYMREYLNENDNSIRKYIYLATNNRMYFVEMKDQDTITFHDASDKPFENYQIVKGETDTILDCSCPSWKINYRHFEKNFNDTINFREQYFFCHQLPVNPDYYKNYYIWSEVIKKEKSVALKFTEEMEGYFKIFYTAKKINPVKVDDHVFEFDKNAVLVKRTLKD